MRRLIYPFRLPHPIKGECGTTLKLIRMKSGNASAISTQTLKFENLSVNDIVSEFTTTVLDILSRLIPNKIAICNDKDLPWITPEIETAIKRKHQVYNKYVKCGRRLDEWENVRVIRNDTSKMITTAKNNYFASLGRKLSNPNIGIKKFGLHLTGS